MSTQGKRILRGNALQRWLPCVLGIGLLSVQSWPAHADTVPATAQSYGPPYTGGTQHFSIPPANTLTDEYNILVATYKQFYGPITASCGYPLVVFPAPQSNGAVGYVTYTSPCHGGPDYFYATIYPGGCPAGYTPDQPPPNTTTCSRPDVSITAGEVIIPSGSTVDSNGDVLTNTTLNLTITKAGVPDPGVSLSLQSDRGGLDILGAPGPGDIFGDSTASASTRDQPGPSTITSATSNVNTLQPGVVTWLPARYEDTFKVTCYAVAQEAQDIGGPMITIPGISGTHHQEFLTDSNLQGSGLLLEGGFMQRNWHKAGYYQVNSCPLTTDGSCADENSAAVDGKVIPLDSSFSIDSVGTRTAEDTGDDIQGHHIDVFFGRTAQDYSNCEVFSTSKGHVVTLLNYGN